MCSRLQSVPGGSPWVRTCPWPGSLQHQRGSHVPHVQLCGGLPSAWRWHWGHPVSLWWAHDKLLYQAKSHKNIHQQLSLTHNILFSGGRTGPAPTIPQPNPTTDIYPTIDENDATDDPEPTEPTPTTTTRPVDPTKDACKMTKFDTITVIQGELHFFKDGWANPSVYLCYRSKKKNKKKTKQTNIMKKWNYMFTVCVNWQKLLEDVQHGRCRTQRTIFSISEVASPAISHRLCLWGHSDQETVLLLR